MFQKSVKLLEMYFFYSVTMVVAYLLVVVLICCDLERFQTWYYVMFQYSLYINCELYMCIGFGVIVVGKTIVVISMIFLEVLCFLKP